MPRRGRQKRVGHVVRFKHKRKSSRRRGKRGRSLSSRRYGKGTGSSASNPRTGTKLVRLIKRIAAGQIETHAVYNAAFSYDNNPYNGWGNLTGGYGTNGSGEGDVGFPTVIGLNLKNLSFGTYRPAGDRVTIVGIKVHVSVHDNNTNKSANHQSMFRHFWMRGGVNSVLTGNIINGMVVNPKPLHGATLVFPAIWSWAAEIPNNVQARFLYKELGEFTKRWDTGWVNLTQKKFPQDIVTVPPGFALQDNYMVGYRDYSKYLKVNTEFEFSLDIGTGLYDIEGWIPQYLVFVYTGSNLTAPDCDILVDVYFKDP